VWKDHFRRTNPAATRRGFDLNVPILTSARAAPCRRYDKAAAPAFFAATLSMMPKSGYRFSENIMLQQ